MRGFDVFMTTGGRTNIGVNVERSAKKAGSPPQEYSTAIARSGGNSGTNWESLAMNSSARRMRGITGSAMAVQALPENGYIEKGHYTASIACTTTLMWWTAGPGDPCPDCGADRTSQKENYFFNLPNSSRSCSISMRKSGFHSPRGSERSFEFCARRAEESLDYSHHDSMGHSGAGRSAHVFYVWFDRG